MDWGSGTGQVVNTVHLYFKGVHNIMAQKLETRMGQQGRNVCLVARKQVVQADHLMPGPQKTLAKMTAKETSPACYQYSHLMESVKKELC